MLLYRLFELMKIPSEPLLPRTNWNVFLTVHGTVRSTVLLIKLEKLILARVTVTILFCFEMTLTTPSVCSVEHLTFGQNAETCHVM